MLILAISCQLSVDSYQLPGWGTVVRQQTTEQGIKSQEPRTKNQDERTRSKEQRLLGMILLS